MRILIIQNDAGAPPGILGRRIVARGIAHDIRQPAAGQAVPAEVNGYAGLAVLGGPQSAADFQTWPYLAEEAALMTRFTEAGVPVLGICLGGQLLARALGATVHRDTRGEIGYRAILPATEGADTPGDPVLGDLGGAPLPEWHNDCFDIPPGADWLLRSQTCPPQAFRAGRSYGVQFHCEADAAIFGDWQEKYAHRHESHEPGITRRLAREIEDHAPLAEAMGSAIADRWLNLLGG
ncbi:MAG: type 1 glutamine amidotransferase [Azospirillaceae bacterium]